MSLTQDIKDFALDLGYSRVGFTTADGFPDYIEELESRRKSYAFFIEGPRKPLAGAHPRSLMPSAKSIVSLVYDYSKESFPENLVGKIGRLYLTRSYNAPEHRIHGARHRLMREFLEKNGCQIGQGICVPERLTGARAGVVTYGRNTFAYAEGIGSFIILYSLVVDVKLDHDEPTMKLGCPAKCSFCIDACPTGAIYEPLKMDPRRCIAFNNFWTRDGAPGGLTSYISPEMREKMGTCIHGCDICQEVCPRNKGRLNAELPPDEFLSHVAKDLDLPSILNLSDELYAKRVQPIMYNYLQEKKYFQRNAAIALGNTGDPTFIPHLAQAMEDPEDLVRGYAAWALGRIGGSRAKQILEASLSRETSEFARSEIEAALAAAA